MYNYSVHNLPNYKISTNQPLYEQGDFIAPGLVDHVEPNHGQIPSMPPINNLGYSPQLFNSYDGFIRGNMFTNLYDPYIANEPFGLTPQTEREALLNKIREYDFAMVDLDLYLDTHPEDAEKIKAYNHFLIQHKQATNEYESRYGPLSLESEALNSYPWAWLVPPWPWEGR